MANRKTDKDRVLEQNGARLVGEFRRRLAAAEKTAKAVPQGENVVSLPQAASPFKPAPIEAPAPNRIAQIREIARRAAMGESAEAAQSPYIQWVNGQSDEIFPGGDAPATAKTAETVAQPVPVVEQVLETEAEAAPATAVGTAPEQEAAPASDAAEGQPAVIRYWPRDFLSYSLPADAELPASIDASRPAAPLGTASRFFLYATGLGFAAFLTALAASVALTGGLSALL